MGFTDKNHTLPTFTATTGGSLLTFQGLVRVNFLPQSRSTPYLIGGAGASEVSGHVKAKPAAGFVWVDTATTEERTLVSASSTGMAFSFGGGVDVFASEQVFFSLEAKWVHATVDKDKFGTDGLNAVGTFLKAGWKF